MYNIFTVSKLYILSNQFLLTFNWRNNDVFNVNDIYTNLRHSASLQRATMQQ